MFRADFELDVLVNNAGFSSNWKDTSSLADVENLEKKLWSIEEYVLPFAHAEDSSDWANMTAIHVAGPYYLAIRGIPFFKKSQDPSVVNITSLASIFLNRAVCEYSYAQSKAAEAHLTRLMAAGLGPLGIRVSLALINAAQPGLSIAQVNSIVPGLFPSQLTTDPNGNFWQPMQDSIANIPKGRAGKLEEIAGPVLMLASPAGAYLNGAEILIDGGWNMVSGRSDQADGRTLPPRMFKQLHIVAGTK